ncbi:ROK family transcriptional regulator [Microbacterium sp. zg-Y818]|uniref:ROK family transcriptional regulator n=1 Tax=unclassified Microbacterium TaxID=2609290 RepID=UPI00214CFB44|nr:MULTISPECIES: ROK family transcriptional regulator [unclassified Microbacterium]MCR2799520.1 ROK family transcriptional regulator [Microbacterium sp. zg.Y818]WIM21515.1 ROK family transcriptional regulator [Microbacterium sp. zg-Y818]
MPGPGDILELVRSGRAVTRGEILEVTGLSRMTVSARVDALRDADLVIENGTDRVTGGRPSRRLEFNTSRASLVIATVDTTHTTVALTDLAGRVTAEERVEVAVADGPDRTLNAIVDSARGILDANGRAERLGGVGICIPGPVDPDSGRPSQPPIMPGWDAYPVGDHLRDALGAPVLVANDADAAGLGEQRSAHPASRSLCFIKVSSGIGTGIILDGQVYRGADGGAGDIGHVKLAGHDDDACQCGAHGCLAAVASGRAVARKLSALGKPATSGSDVGAYLAAGDADAARLTQAAGRVIGEVVATVVTLLNPAEVVLGGMLASAPLLAGVRETLYPRSLPRATRHLAISQSTLGERAAIVGLATLVVEREYSAGAVNAALGA